MSERLKVSSARAWSGRAKWRAIVASTSRSMSADRVNVAAGAFAYRWFLSIFPLIIALLGIASLVTLPRSVIVGLIHGVTEALPPSAAHVLADAISHTTLHASENLPATVLALVVALWSALSGMVIVEEGLDMAYGLVLDRSFVNKRMVALQLLVGGVILGGSASALTVFGSPLGRQIRGAVPVSGELFPVVWAVLRWVVALALINLLFSLLYYLAPNRPRPRWRWTSVGALVATFIWAFVSFGFSLYTSEFTSYDRTYGALAGVAILIFWLYLTGVAIFVGGEVNAAIERLPT
jgi:membrane protein